MQSQPKKESNLSIRIPEEPRSTARPQESPAKGSDSSVSQAELIVETLDELRLSVNKTIQKHKSQKAKREEDRAAIDRKNPTSMISSVKKLDNDKRKGMAKLRMRS